jgi:small GTP-binding protein
MQMRVKENYDVLAKMIIIGDSGVGKTNLILSFVGDPFKDNYVATIGVDFKAKTINVDDKKVKLQIWDTAGQERYRTITETYYKGASAILLAYAVDDRGSFDNLNKWMMQINEKAPPGVPKIILANKKDLETDRVVSKEEGRQLAEHYSTENCTILFAEVSAKTGEGVNESINAISKRVKEDFERENTIKPIIKIAKISNND